MKKVFLSVGIGMILFSFLFFALNYIKPPEPYTISGDEIHSKALELGMIDKKDIPTTQTTTEEIVEETTAELSDYEIAKMARAIGMVYPEDVVPETETTEQDPAVVTTTSVNNTETTEITETTVEPITNVPTATLGVRIISGMNATEITKLLKEKGIIEDSKDFQKYVESKKLTKKLLTGYYHFKVNEDYEFILNTISNKK